MKESHKLQKNISIEMPELEKYQEIVETKKSRLTPGRTQKHKSKEKTPQQQKQIAHSRKQKYKRLKEEA